MTILTTRNRDIHHWLVAITKTHIYWLHKQARIGDCFRLGQKLKEPTS